MSQGGHALLAIAQTILHYLSLLGILLGVIALLFGNTGRGFELLIGGICLMVIKYLIGFVYLSVARYINKDQ